MGELVLNAKTLGDAVKKCLSGLNPKKNTAPKKATRKKPTDDRQGKIMFYDK